MQSALPQDAFKITDVLRQLLRAALLCDAAALLELLLT